MTINQLIQVNTYEKKNGKKEKTINLPLMRERERERERELLSLP